MDAVPSIRGQSLEPLRDGVEADCASGASSVSGDELALLERRDEADAIALGLEPASDVISEAQPVPDHRGRQLTLDVLVSKALHEPRPVPRSVVDDPEPACFLAAPFLDVQAGDDFGRVRRSILMWSVRIHDELGRSPPALLLVTEPIAISDRKVELGSPLDGVRLDVRVPLTKRRHEEWGEAPLARLAAPLCARDPAKFVRLEAGPSGPTGGRDTGDRETIARRGPLLPDRSAKPQDRVVQIARNRGRRRPRSGSTERGDGLRSPDFGCGALDHPYRERA